MNPSREPLSAILARFKAAARQAGIKLTHQRLEILREVATRQDHPSAEMIYQALKPRLPTLSLDTVYRTLWLLKDLGLIDTLKPTRGHIRFDANLNPHHHYICIRCGLVRDFESGDLNTLPVPRSVTALGRVDAVRVEVWGVCRDCLQKSEPSGGAP